MDLHLTRFPALAVSKYVQVDRRGVCSLSGVLPLVTFGHRDYMQRKIPFKGIQPLPSRVGEPCQTKATTNEQIWIGRFHGPVLALAADRAVKSPRRGRMYFPVFILSLRVQARCPGTMAPSFLDSSLVYPCSRHNSSRRPPYEYICGHCHVPQSGFREVVSAKSSNIIPLKHIGVANLHMSLSVRHLIHFTYVIRRLKHV